MLSPEIVQLIAFYVVFLFSITLHEASHAVAAHLMGDSTAAAGGQATLDPIPHIRRSPFGMVLLPILSLFIYGFPIGFASAPYNVEWALRNPRKAGLMALAGPVSNLLLVIICGIAIGVLFRLGLAYPTPGISITDFAVGGRGKVLDGVLMMLELGFSLNLLLVVFNFLPLPPLDGSAIVNLLLPMRASEKYQTALLSNPWISIIGILLSWKLIGYVFGPVFIWTLNLVYKIGFA